jgi:hypothetical protein
MGKQEDAARKLKEREAAARKRFKLPEGLTHFRLMPNAKGVEKSEYVDYFMHSNVGPRKAYIRCGKNVKGEGDCWLCDVTLPKLEASDKASKRKAAEDMAAVQKFAVQIAIIDEDEHWSGPFLWEMPPSLGNGLLGVLSRKPVGDPQKGYNLTVTRTGTTFTGTKYSAIERDDERSAVPEKILARLKPFGEVIKKYNEEAMKAAYFGHEQEDDETEEEVTSKKKPTAEEEEDETPAPKKKKPAPEPEEDIEEDAPPPKKKKPAPEPEEDADEDAPPPKKKKPAPEPEEDVEEDTPPPKKKKPVPADDDDDVATALADDDFDGDVPDLEADEDAPPPKKKKAAPEPEEEEEAPPPKKKKPPVEEDADEDAPPPKKKKPAPEPDEDEEEAPPPKKKKPAADDDF